MTNKLSIVIIDDHPIVRNGLRQIIEQEHDFVIRGEASDGEAGVKLIQEMKPEMVLLDLDIPKLDGFGVIRQVRQLQLAVNIILLTIHGEVDLLHRALELGAKGYILKESALLEIVSGIRSIAAGRPYVSPSLTPALLKRRTVVEEFERGNPELCQLTPAERRILVMIAEGKSSKEIAQDLHIHYRTVETHRARICQKLQLNGPNTLLRFALKHRSELAL
jgi:DNA-binding NarL/FixJ family response regulator